MRRNDYTLKNVLISVPEHCRSNRHYKNCIEFLENKEPGLALDSLIELTNETGYSFSTEYWLALATCADSMNIKESADFCRKHILS